MVDPLLQRFERFLFATARIAPGVAFLIIVIYAVSAWLFPKFLWPEGMSANVLATILGTVATAGVLTPLIGSLVARRRESELAPVRQSFVLLLNDNANRLAFKEIQFLSTLGLAARTVEGLTSVTTLKTAMETFSTRVARMTGRDKEVNSDRSAEILPITLTAIDGASVIRDLAASHLRDMNLLISEMDHALLFCIPVFPPSSISAISNARHEILEFRNRLQDLMDIVSGRARIVRGKYDPVQLAGARRASLSLHTVFANLKAAAEPCGKAIQDAVALKYSDDMGAFDLDQAHRTIIELLVDVFPSALESDLKIHGVPPR